MTSRAPDVEGLTLLSVVARTGSLGAAARTMGLAQPNASRMLARLERDLGLSLVDRSPSGSRLTPHGRLVVDWAEPVLTALDRLAAGAESLREDRASHLVVGASLTVGEHLVPRWLTRFRSEQPEVQVRIRVMNSADVVAAVESRTIDVGFVESPTVPSSLQYRSGCCRSNASAGWARELPRVRRGPLPADPGALVRVQRLAGQSAGVSSGLGAEVRVRPRLETEAGK